MEIVVIELHKDTTFAVLMTLFPFVMLPLIGFSNNYEWDNNVSVDLNGPINSNNSSMKISMINKKNLFNFF